MDPMASSSDPGSDAGPAVQRYIAETLTPVTTELLSSLLDEMPEAGSACVIPHVCPAESPEVV